MHVARVFLRSAVAAALALTTFGPSATMGEAPTTTHGAVVSAAVHHDVSGPLRDAGGRAPSAANLRERPLKLVGPGSNPNTPDGAIQGSPGGQLAASGGPGFPGVGNGDYGFSPQYAPPDTVGAVGATQYVQWVNVNLAVFDKATGAIASGFPKLGNAVWAGFGGGCETNNDGDAIVEYDKIANRWILTQFSVATKPYLQCVAVSTTSDATGSYYRYAFSYGSTLFNDYPKLSVWPDAYYITFNMFGSTFAGADVCAYDRSKMLAGAAATQQCFQLSSAYGGLLPSDLDGSILPPAGAPNPILNFGTNSLNLWRFHVDWASPAATSLQGPVSIPVASFARACNGSNCVPQPGTSQKLDSLGDRLMYRLAYRRFADGHESLVVNHSVSVGGNFFNSGVSSVRWYELQNAPNSTIGSATPVVHQQGTLDTSDGIHRWMGSAAMDMAGDMALGYSASNASVYPSIRYTGRTPSDPLNTMETESVVKAGTGSQLQNLSRWGDYSSMTVDPVDDCTFWYTTEYLKTNGTWNWSTWITSFRFPNCGSTVAPDFTISATPASQSVAAGGNGQFTVSVALTGGAQPVQLSATGAPAGAITFGTNPTSSSSMMTVPTSASTTPRTYQITVTGTSGSAVHQTSVNLVVTAPAGTPTAPQNLRAAPANGKGVQLVWTPTANDGGSPLTGYRVYRGPTSTSLTPLTSIGNVTSYKDTATVRGQTYWYAVTAVNAAGEGGPSNTVSAVAK
ncbi:MAG: hypothetical protein QOC97_988 [Chloroflexota bacterium]|nr:hypothetical protein [Chloroflexota bacterium]